MALGGMEMMLKSMGINPEEIKASIESFKKLATEVSERQKNVEMKLERIEAKIDELLSEGQNILTKESMAEHFAEAGEPIENQKGWEAPNLEDAYGDAAGSSGN